jgi:hypothetical protein
MAHFARVKDGVVVEVLVIADDSIGGGEFPRDEPAGVAFLTSIGLGGEWVQTSYHGRFRGVFAGPGYRWDGTRFHAPDGG